LSSSDIFAKQFTDSQFNLQKKGSMQQLAAMFIPQADPVATEAAKPEPGQLRTWHW